MRTFEVELDVLEDVSAEIQTEGCKHDLKWTSKVYDEMFLENPTLLRYVDGWIRVHKNAIKGNTMETPFDQLTHKALYYLNEAMNKLPIDEPDATTMTRADRQKIITELRTEIKESMSRKTVKPRSIIFVSRK